ncbi:MAG TPA: amidohydrolase family protein [Acidimicrobiales bacterium]|nr:amidohydrolase family protein [Acidimicrobiales bacterium]
MPRDVGVVDLMIAFPRQQRSIEDFTFRSQLTDEGSAGMQFPAEYMFKQLPDNVAEDQDPVEATLGEMDKYGVAIGLVGIGSEAAERAVREHPDRFAASIHIDPNKITPAVRRIRKASDEFAVKAVSVFPAGCVPQVPISDRRLYPVYQTCIDLDIPIILNAGVPGPRLPMECQDVRHFDQVCYDFPELRIVMCHGAEPWEDLAVKLMLKWPGLFYMPSAFAPKYYPKAILDYANSRGADKIMYAGYHPIGLTLERIFGEMPDVPLKDEVWPKFLRENAMAVFKLGRG